MTGSDRVHANAALAEVVRPGTSEGPNGGLRGAVNAHPWKAFDRSDRRGQDDRPAIVHEWQALLHGEEQSPHVGVEVEIEELLIDAAERRQLRDACVGKDDVDLLTVPANRFVQAVDVTQIGDVA